MGKKKIVTKSAEEASLKAIGSRGVSSSRRDDVRRIFINSSFNNTLVTATNKIGEVIAWASAGSLGFSGPKKSTPFAASRIVAAIVEKLKGTPKNEVEIFVKGVGSGRDSAIRSIVNQGFNVVAIHDATPVAHNGPRPPKPRRV